MCVHVLIHVHVYYICVCHFIKMNGDILVQIRCFSLFTDVCDVH